MVQVLETTEVKVFFSFGLHKLAHLLQARQVSNGRRLLVFSPFSLLTADLSLTVEEML